eukprot:COSAG03_NODE_13523_length_500_cov_0.451372_1_plen_69_part_10
MSVNDTLVATGNISDDTHDGEEVFVDVTVRTEAGSYTSALSDGVIYDSSPPSTKAVVDGSGLYNEFGHD